MTKIKFSVKDVFKRSAIKKHVFSIAVAIVFLVIMVVYILRLYSETRDKIITDGELNAIKYATTFDGCLSPGISTLMISAQITENCLKRGASQEEILNKLVEGTESIMDSKVTNTTGLYACIDNNYLDGANWVPEEGYIPYERPWYIEAVEHPGEITVVEPYLDVMSDSVIITLAKCLDDGKSVVALDLFMDDIQDTTEKIADNADLTIMVLCNHGTVVTHSNRDELGKNYNTASEGLGSLICNKIFSERDNNFEIKYKNNEYLVYAVPIQNGWYSVCVMDSEKAYKPLRLLVWITVMISLAVIAILTILLLRSVKQELIAKRLDQILSSTADIYMSLCDMDIENNSVTEIKNVNPIVSAAIARCGNNLREEFLKIMQNLPESPTKQAALNFCDISKIEERFMESNVPTLEYVSFGNIWVRARFVVSERNANGDITHVLWMIENIDHEKKEREKLVNLSERAIAASEAKSAFLSNMSHEIRTPITAVLGFNEMITRECDNEVILGYAENIKNAGNTLLGIINDILDFSKIEAGKMEIIPTRYRFAATLSNMVNMIRGRAESKGLTLVTDFDPNIPSMFYGDEVRIKQIIINILTNAVKYTEKGQVTFTVGYERIEGDDENVMLHVTVKDTGIGIKPEDMSRLFSEFERMDEKRNRSIEGTGLGMSITKSLLNMMGSMLDVQSEYGKGSVFGFYLKQKVEKWEPIGNAAGGSAKPASGQNGYQASFTAPDAKALVIDDNAVNLVVFVGLLKETEVQVDTADSGAKGLELVKQNKYDIIFLDHMMPGMDGIETLEKMKQSPDNLNLETPVICLTANAVSGAREKYLEIGFDNYLTKPIDPAELEEMLVVYLPQNLVEPNYDYY